MNELDSAMYAVWQAYYTKLREYFPKAHGDGNGPFEHKYRKAFEKIAQWCVDNDVSAVDFMAVTFPFVRMEARTILPRDFHKKAVFRYYAQHKRDSVQANPEQQWELQVRQLEGIRERCPEYKTVAAILAVLPLPFDFWFRVLFLKQFDEGLFADYGEMAWLELREPQSRELREFLRKKRPANMQELERRIASFGDVI